MSIFEPYSKWGAYRSRITDPLKMNHTYVGVEINPSKNECYSYAYNGVWEQREERDMSMPGGAGNIVSTPNDLVVFITALFNHKLVSDSSLKKMKSIKNGIGMGLNEYEFNGVIAYGHLGGIDGFSAVMGYFPMDSMAISYTTNGQFYALKDIMLGCLAICFNKPYKLPSSSILVRKDILEKFIGDYTSEQLPVKIKITMKDSQLYAKFKGEEPFKLEAKGNNKFSYEEGDIQVVFNADTNEMTMRQVGKVFLFRRKGK
ncbi:MAG: serine hydrolase [bacterium]|nr:serine hydrolase [bacterium]